MIAYPNATNFPRKILTDEKHGQRGGIWVLGVNIRTGEVAREGKEEKMGWDGDYDVYVSYAIKCISDEID